MANYPFCTIEPNVGVIEVPDERLSVLADVIAGGDPSTSLGMKRPPIVPAAVQFYDIAGLVKGASKGEGLGNQFLSHIREVSVIVHVVRLFEDSDVVHVSPTLDPKSDIDVIETELIFADLSTLDKQKEPKGSALKEDVFRYQVVVKLKEQLNKGVSARNVSLSDEERQAILQLNLLTLKPVLYVFNISEKQLENLSEVEKKIDAIVKSVEDKAPYLFFCAKLENEILSLSDLEQREYLEQYSLHEVGLNRLIKKTYEMLGLISYLTGGEKEVRAWTIQEGTKAPQAAAVIHTDFEKHFIKADVIPYPLFVELDGWIPAREAGKVQSAGRDYVMKDGDVVEFKIGV